MAASRGTGLQRFASVHQHERELAPEGARADAAHQRDVDRELDGERLGRTPGRGGGRDERERSTIEPHAADELERRRQPPLEQVDVRSHAEATGHALCLLPDV